MGSTVIITGAIGLSIALACLLAGYLWGRSNVRMQVEDAIKKERISAVAREFTLRQQLEEKMEEVSKLSARIEEQTHSLQTRDLPQRSVLNVAAHAPHPIQDLPGHEAEPIVVVESAETRIHNLLKSLQDKPTAAEEQTNAAPVEALSIQAEKKPDLPVHKTTAPDKVAAPVKKPTPTKRPTAVKVPAPKPHPIVQDEWQEFAASLAALTREKK